MIHPVALDQPLRCLHYLDAVREEAGGVVRAVLDLVEGLAQAGVEVTLLTSDAQDVPDAWRASKPNTPRVVTIRRAMTPLLSIAAADRPAIDELLTNTDVLHLHTPWDRYNVALVGAAHRCRTPYVVSAHGMLDHWSMSQRRLKKQLYLRLVGRRMLCGAYALHCTSASEQQQALSYAPGSSGHVLPLLLDLVPCAATPGAEAALQAFPKLAVEDPKLLFLGRVHPQKGVERLVRAAANLHKSGSPVQVFVAGPGEADYLQQLKSLAAELGIAERVHFLGMVRGETKLSLYQACDLFVLPTSQESFGIVLIEAIAYGLPTVTTRGVDIAEELQQFGAVIVSEFAEQDEQELTAAIRSLLDQPPSEASVTKMRAGVLEWLDPQRVINGYIKLYQNAAGR